MLCAANKVLREEKKITRNEWFDRQNEATTESKNKAQRRQIKIGNAEYLEIQKENRREAKTYCTGKSR